MKKPERKRRRRNPLRMERLEPRLVLSFSPNYHPVIVDPPDRLAGSSVLGEWYGTTLDGEQCRQFVGRRRCLDGHFSKRHFESDANRPAEHFLRPGPRLRILRRVANTDPIAGELQQGTSRFSLALRPAPGLPRTEFLRCPRQISPRMARCTSTASIWAWWFGGATP